jgi:hypothetical protein
MAYSRVLIHGETEDEIADDDRYLDVKTSDGCIVLHSENDECFIDMTIDVAEALALIRSLTEAIEDLS